MCSQQFWAELIVRPHASSTEVMATYRSVQYDFTRADAALGVLQRVGAVDLPSEAWHRGCWPSCAGTCPPQPVIMLMIQNQECGIDTCHMRPMALKCCFNKDYNMLHICSTLYAFGRKVGGMQFIPGKCSNCIQMPCEYDMAMICFTLPMVERVRTPHCYDQNICYSHRSRRRSKARQSSSSPWWGLSQGQFWHR